MDRIELHPRSPDSLLESVDALLDALDVAVDVVAARRERHLLAVNDFLHLRRVGQPVDDLGRKGDFLFLPHLGLQPCIDGRQADAPQEQPLQLPARRGVVQLEQDLSGFHLVAFAHEDFADHSAFEMLDDLVLTGNDEHAGGDHGAGDRRHVSPDAEAHQHHRHDQRTGNGR